MDKKELKRLRREIELDLNCVTWITDKQRKLLDSILDKQFKNAEGEGIYE